MLLCPPCTDTVTASRRSSTGSCLVHTYIQMHGVGTRQPTAPHEKGKGLWKGRAGLDGTLHLDGTFLRMAQPPAEPEICVCTYICIVSSTDNAQARSATARDVSLSFSPFLSPPRSFILMGDGRAAALPSMEVPTCRQRHEPNPGPSSLPCATPN